MSNKKQNERNKEKITQSVPSNQSKKLEKESSSHNNRKLNFLDNSNYVSHQEPRPILKKNDSNQKKINLTTKKENSKEKQSKVNKIEKNDNAKKSVKKIKTDSTDNKTLSSKSNINNPKMDIDTPKKTNATKKTGGKRKRKTDPQKSRKKRKMNTSSNSDADNPKIDSDSLQESSKTSYKKAESNKNKLKNSTKESAKKGGSKPREKYHVSHTKPPKKPHKDNYIFTLEETIRNDIQKRVDDIRKYSERHHYHSNSEEEDRSSLSTSDHSETERLENAGLLMVPRVNLGVKEHENNKNYPKGDGNGEVYKFTREGITFGARIDLSIKGTFNVRAGLYKEVEVMEKEKLVKKWKVIDKSTKNLAVCLDGKTEEYKTYFLKALKGERRKGLSENKKEEAYQAFTDGLEVRIVLLISDSIHYPGNSVITEKMIQNTTEENYKHLFLGDKNEGSYGAIPNQNTNTRLENTQRIQVYNTVGNFFSTGHYHGQMKFKGDANIFRKIRSMTQNLADEDFINIQKNNKEVSISDFQKLTLENHGKTKKESVKKEIAKLTDDNGYYVSEEEDSSTERNKITDMTSEERNEYEKKQKNIKRISTNRLQYVEDVNMKDVSKDKSGVQKLEVSSDSEENSAELIKKYKALKPEELEKVQREAQQKSDEYLRLVRLTQKASQPKDTIQPPSKSYSKASWMSQKKPNNDLVESEDSSNSYSQSPRN